MSQNKQTHESVPQQNLLDEHSKEGSPCTYRHISKVDVHMSNSRHSEDEQIATDRADADSLDSGIGLIDMGQRQPGVGVDAVSSVSSTQDRSLPVGRNELEESQSSSSVGYKTDIHVRPLPEGAQSNHQPIPQFQPQSIVQQSHQSINQPSTQSITRPSSQSIAQPNQSIAQPTEPITPPTPLPRTSTPPISHSSPQATSAPVGGPVLETVGIQSGLEKTVSLGILGIQVDLKAPVQEHSVSFDVPNGCEKSGSLTNMFNFDEDADGQVKLRKSPSRRPMRHAHSEIEAISDARRRSQSMAEIKEHAYQRLQDELDRAQTDLRLKDEEVGKLSKVRYQMEQELDDLTASLFEEANKMVQDANVKRMHTEKLLQEATQQIEVLQAEVEALKQLVLTSTPSSPNKHLHPQISEGKEKKSTKPFWKTHRRSTSHHEFTKESRQQAEAQQGKEPVSCKEFDTVCYNEFLQLRHGEGVEGCGAFLHRINLEDISPCLNFSNKKLSERVQQCVDRNTLTIEPIPVQNSYPRKCSLTETNKLCNYRIKLDDGQNWYSISQMCRNRIASVCDFYTYIRYIRQGLVKTEDKEAFLEIVRLRRQMALARLGLA